eukprot:4012135-Pyramimonas_sp.AAC.1
MQNLTAWLEGCPCHECILVHRSSYQQKKAMEREFGKGRDCPMKGKRAPELAAGALRDVVEVIGQMGRE